VLVAPAPLGTGGELRARKTGQTKTCPTKIEASAATQQRCSGCGSCKTAVDAEDDDLWDNSLGCGRATPFPV